MRALYCLVLVAATAAPARAERVHTVRPGDTLWGLARRYHTSVDAIKRRNHLRSDMLRDGRRLIIERRDRERPRRTAVRPSDGRQSVGLPYRGRLLHAVQLPTSAAYVRRRPQNSWGTSTTIRHVKRIAEAVRRRYPSLHRLAIGDISDRNGGYLAPHASHQSGRDVDIGFYFKRRPDGYPRAFIRGTAGNLDMAANWLMLERFCDLTGVPGGVDKVFLVTSLQKLFYDHGRRNGVSRRQLDRMFQYPARAGADTGCIRHERGHDDHIHVRFKR
jgi:LysM repeat protein